MLVFCVHVYGYINICLLSDIYLTCNFRFSFEKLFTETKQLSFIVHLKMNALYILSLSILKEKVCLMKTNWNGTVKTLLFQPDSS